MPPFLKGAVTGALLTVAVGGFALWAATFPKEPPPLIEKQLMEPHASNAQLKAALAVAFPSGGKASALRQALGRSGFAVDGTAHSAAFVAGDLVCSNRFTVTWKEAPGDVLVSVDGGFSEVCL